MVLIKLALLFAKVGLLGFGGGYAIIPMIERELANLGWLSAPEFANVVAISQMTPGPLVVNAATFVGYKIAGVWGSVVATFSVTLPSFIIVVLVSMFLVKFQKSKVIAGIFAGIRPVTVGMMAAAMWFFINMSFIVLKPTFIFDISLFVIFAVAIVLTKIFKLNPVLVILISMVLGLVLA